MSDRYKRAHRGNNSRSELHLIKNGGQGSRSFTPNQQSYIYKRDKTHCIYCGEYADTIDHVVPYSKGGITSTANGVCCCNKCNHDKQDKIEAKYIIDGLVYLARVGEDLTWVDRLLTVKDKNADKIDVDYRNTIGHIKTT